MKKIILIFILILSISCNKEQKQKQESLTSKQKKENSLIEDKPRGMYAGEDVVYDNSSTAITAEVRFLKENRICETENIPAIGNERIMLTFPVENWDKDPLVKGDTLQLCGYYPAHQQSTQKSQVFAYKNKYWHVEYAHKSLHEYGHEVDHCDCYTSAVITKIMR